MGETHRHEENFVVDRWREVAMTLRDYHGLAWIIGEEYGSSFVLSA
jgi:hypothetical protein